ncbi:MAG: ATP-binding protein [bacterium]|nr:ATP-binding protein [bacterium]
MNHLHDTVQAGNDAELADLIESSTPSSPVDTTLQTSERVLSRVTDGIYRQPGSAIRELISNAYDADASQVVIKTDRPRFSVLSIADDGIGMTPAALAHLIRNIGGSAKRSMLGAELGITNRTDPAYSPSGRRLIGKIGIGLFSIAQLTHRFQIITKTTGDPFRTVASVVLRQDSDEGGPSTGEGEDYEAGRVNIWREPAADTDSQGTTIILTDIRPQTRDTLQSRDVWAAIDSDGDGFDTDLARDLRPPDFHIGRVRRDDFDALQGNDSDYRSLPWTDTDHPETAFKKLVAAVWQRSNRGVPNPQLIRIFDYYLRMVWQLSLAIPVPYVEGNPFDLPLQDNAYLFEMPLAGRGSPTQFVLAGCETIRSKTSIGSGTLLGSDFTVLFDDLQLARPLAFLDLPPTAHAVKKPILFVGRCREEFEGVEAALTGGPLEFEAYLMWAPKIVPTENRGVLVRLHGSSGTLFDPTFMRYQVSEQTRLRQISCEVFVSKGMEGALNIDRESFNYAHPHVVYITKWLHTSLRQVATVQKRIAATIRKSHREAAVAEEEEILWRIVTNAWRLETDDPGAEPPPVNFYDAEEQLFDAQHGAYRFRRAAVFDRRRGLSARQDEQTARKLRAIVQLLAAHGILEDLNGPQQERLLAYVRRVLEVSEI